MDAAKDDAKMEPEFTLLVNYDLTDNAVIASLEALRRKTQRNRLRRTAKPTAAILFAPEDGALVAEQPDVVVEETSDDTKVTS